MNLLDLIQGPYQIHDGIERTAPQPSAHLQIESGNTSGAFPQQMSLFPLALHNNPSLKELNTRKAI